MDGFRNNVRRYEARFQQAAINYQQTVLNADKEVEKALIAFLKAQERAGELQGAVNATRRSVDLALIQYKEGAITFERVFNLQNVLVRQQIDQARTRAEISLALIDVYRAAGRMADPTRHAAQWRPCGRKSPSRQHRRRDVAACR